MSFKILVRNPGSALARALAAAVEDLPLELLDPGVDSSAWSNRSALGSYFSDHEPNIVISLLPDEGLLAHAQQELRSIKALADSCRQRKLPLLQMSSYRVFGDNYSSQGYTETDPPQPEDELGRFLLSLEQTAAGAGQHLIIRLPWLMDLGGESLLQQIVPPLVEGRDLRVSSYFQGAVVSTVYVARVLVACVQQLLCGAENWGVFHLHSSDVASEAEFADAVLRLLRAELQRELLPPEVVGEKDGARLTTGSANLRGRRITDDFGVQLPSWRVGFKGLTRQWLTAGCYVAQKKAGP